MDTIMAVLLTLLLCCSVALVFVHILSRRPDLLQSLFSTQAENERRRLSESTQSLDREAFEACRAMIRESFLASMETDKNDK
jgi:hypothetical protein